MKYLTLEKLQKCRTSFPLFQVANGNGQSWIVGYMKEEIEGILYTTHVLYMLRHSNLVKKKCEGLGVQNFKFLKKVD